MPWPVTKDYIINTLDRSGVRQYCKDLTNLRNHVEHTWLESASAVAVCNCQAAMYIAITLQNFSTRRCYLLINSAHNIDPYHVHLSLWPVISTPRSFAEVQQSRYANIDTTDLLDAATKIMPTAKDSQT